MKKNVGKLDMILRIVIGLIIGGIGYYMNSWWGLIGIIPFMTAFMGCCPLYRLIGINTCPLKNK